MLIQFLRDAQGAGGSCKIDGCNTFKNAVYVIVPMLKPSLVSCALVSVHVDQQRFPGPVDLHCGYAEIYELRIPAHVHGRRCWLPVEPYPAMSLISIVPSLIVFFCAQDSFIDGIAAGGVKG